jgi:hypothetical protein
MKHSRTCTPLNGRRLQWWCKDYNKAAQSILDTIPESMRGLQFTNQTTAIQESKRLPKISTLQNKKQYKHLGSLPSGEGVPNSIHYVRMWSVVVGHKPSKNNCLREEVRCAGHILFARKLSYHFSSHKDITIPFLM